MNGNSTLFNQQVAALIVYEATPHDLHRTLRAAPLFNLLSGAPDRLIVRRPWFALDIDRVMEEKIRRVFETLANPQAIMNEIGNAGLHAALAGQKRDPGQQEIMRILQSASGRINLEFARGASGLGVQERLEREIPFAKLSAVLQRLNRALRSHDRGALLAVNISYTPGTDFSRFVR